MKKSDLIRANIENLKNEAKVLMNKEGVTVEELKEIQNRINAEKEKLEIELSFETDLKNRKEGETLPKPEEITGNSKDTALIFAKAIIGKATAQEISEIKNLLQEGVGEKGGLLVPADVKTKIIELQRKAFDIRNYISIETTSVDKGSRVKEKNEPEAVGFASVDEGKEIQLLHEPELEPVEYAIRKYAGYIPITNELLDDSPENVLAYLLRWMAKNELNTYAYQVFNGTGSKSAEGILTEIDGKLADRVVILDHQPTLQDFKNIFNIELEEIDTDSIRIFVNGQGYSHIDGMVDGVGRPYLQPDTTKLSGKSFLGYETVKVPTKFLKPISKNGKTYTPYIIGNLELLYTMYDRKKLGIESTKVGGDAWRNDTTEVKGIFRFDGKISGDKKAISIVLAEGSAVTQFSMRTEPLQGVKNVDYNPVMEATLKGNQDVLDRLGTVLEKLIDAQAVEQAEYKIENLDEDSENTGKVTKGKTAAGK